MTTKTKYFDSDMESLKILRKYFGAVVVGKKPFEVRKNDRGYKPGDKYRLREFVGKNYLSKCEHCGEMYCQQLLNQGYTEEELDEMYERDCTYCCDKNRFRCGEYCAEKYTGRSAVIQIKDVFNLPGEISDYVAFTFDVLEVILERNPYVVIIESEEE